MKHQTFMLQQYIRYRLSARSMQYIHSPFLYSLMLHTFTDRNHTAHNWIEEERIRLKKNNTLVPAWEAGAGSRISADKRTVGSIAKYSLQPPRYARLLMRMATFLQSATAIELGTSLGITTAYLVSANSIQSIDSIEGNPFIASLAQDMFSKHHLHKIKLHNGLFDDVLPQILNTKKKFDFVYIDGNHRREATLQYVNQILPSCHSNTWLVLDDIHWSPDMQQAWTEIIQMPEFTLSIDIFKMGFLFLNPDLQKQHFVLKY